MTSPLPAPTTDELIHWSRVLRRAANGRGPVNIIVCVYCLRTADIRQDEHAWDNWTITPYDECPACIELGRKPDETPVHLDMAEAKFEEALRKVKQHDTKGN